MKTITFLLLIASLCVCVRADDLPRLNEEFTHFHLSPTKQRFDHIQEMADRLAAALKAKGSGADFLMGVFISRAAEKSHWPITGKTAIAETAREMLAGKSRLALYVRDDTKVDVRKLDIWWASFFATGETTFLGKVLSIARYPRAGEHASTFIVPAMAAWSFKSNCRQDATVMAFAKESLTTNRFPQETAFLRECVGAAPAQKAVNFNLVEAKETPTRMMKIVIRRLGQPANSFASEPLVDYFAHPCGISSVSATYYANGTLLFR